MKRFSGGTLGVGMFAFGWALSVGFVSIGMNAVGWIAIGMNAAGFVAVGLVNSIGVFSFGGVNSCGGWGRGGTNSDPSSWLGLVVSIGVALALLVYRVMHWPDTGPLLLVPLGNEAGPHELSAARLGDVGKTVQLRGPHATLSVEVDPAAAERCAGLGSGARVLVRLRRTMRPVEGAGYRDEAGESILELAHVERDPRRTWVASLFEGTLGAHLALAWLGAVAAAAAFFLWR